MDNRQRGPPNFAMVTTASSPRDLSVFADFYLERSLSENENFNTIGWSTIFDVSQNTVG